MACLGCTLSDGIAWHWVPRRAHRAWHAVPRLGRFRLVLGGGKRLAHGALPKPSGVARGASPKSFARRFGRLQHPAHSALLYSCCLAPCALLGLLGLHLQRQQRLAHVLKPRCGRRAQHTVPRLGRLSCLSGRRQRLARGALLRSCYLTPGALLDFAWDAPSTSAAPGMWCLASILGCGTRCLAWVVCAAPWAAATFGTWCLAAFVSSGTRCFACFAWAAASAAATPGVRCLAVIIGPGTWCLAGAS